MKRLIIMLLLASSAVISINADQLAGPQKKPENVIFTLNAITGKYGQNEGQVYSVNRNPNTGIIESSTKIVPFACPANAMKNDNVLNAVAINFPKDEPQSYQFLHIQPGSLENFNLKVITNDGKSNSTVRVRTNRNQEMWLMCTKNTENPQLRDAYAVVWESDGQAVNGTVYMITSLRPDVYEKAQETSSKTFKIVGRVDANIKDSLYNIYIADSAEELENIGDDDYVACVPVINKRFEFQTELDHPCVGRLRCIFPDGELCSAWINLDFVPGETYNITVHNGYFDEDRDYERRVGRNSGKSLLNERQVRGIDDVVQTADTNSDYVEAHPVDPDDFEPSEAEKLQLVMIEGRLKMTKDVIEELYNRAGTIANSTKSRVQIKAVFDNLLKQNKEFDKQLEDFVKHLKSMKCPPEVMMGFFKEIAQMYTQQHKKLNSLYAKPVVRDKSFHKLEEFLNSRTGKYMDKIGVLIQ